MLQVIFFTHPWHFAGLGSCSCFRPRPPRFSAGWLCLTLKRGWQLAGRSASAQWSGSWRRTPVCTHNRKNYKLSGGDTGFISFYDIVTQAPLTMPSFAVRFCSTPQVASCVSSCWLESSSDRYVCRVLEWISQPAPLGLGSSTTGKSKLRWRREGTNQTWILFHNNMCVMFYLQICINWTRYQKCTNISSYRTKPRTATSSLWKS